MTDRSFFVYQHRRNDTGQVFYVGKGTRTRLKKYIRATTTSRRSLVWKRIVAKAGHTVEVLADFFNEQDAFDMEKLLIAQYGRLPAGQLCNLTDGGEGHSGLVASAETRRKMSESAKGTVRTEAQRQAVSRAQRGVPNPVEQCLAHSIRMTGKGNPNFGTKNSPETIAKRVASRGSKCSGANHPFFGKKRPPHVVAKFSGGNAVRARKVVDDATGIVYGCIKEAAASVGKSHSVVQRWLAGKRRNPTALRYA